MLHTNLIQQFGILLQISVSRATFNLFYDYIFEAFFRLDNIQCGEYFGAYAYSG